MSKILHTTFLNSISWMKIDFIEFHRNLISRVQQATSHYLNQWLSLLRPVCVTGTWWVNSLRPRQNGRLFADDIFKCIFLNENARISLKISLKFVPKVRINDIPTLVQIMAWRRPGDKPLSEPMMISLLTHICVTRTRWVKVGLEHLEWPRAPDTIFSVL